jgi:hypothetical protein
MQKRRWCGKALLPDTKRADGCMSTPGRRIPGESVGYALAAVGCEHSVPMRQDRSVYS